MNAAPKNFTIDDCYKILEKKLKTGFIVNSYKFYGLGEVKGYLGEHSILNINYNQNDENHSVRFFTKSLPLTECQQNFMNESGHFVKECRFYRDLMPKLLEEGVHTINDCIATCYLASDNGYLIFEDLSAQNYTTVNYRVSLRMDCVKTGLDALAKLHSAGIIFEEKMKEATGSRDLALAERYPELFHESFFPPTPSGERFIIANQKLTPFLIDLFYDNTILDVELFKRLSVEVFGQFREIVKPSTLYRNTFCHADLWISNFMFKFKNDKAVHSVIVDFQMLRYGPPGQDVMSYLYLSTDRQFRQKHTAELTEYYYGKLGAILEEHGLCHKKILPHDEFIASCNYYKLFASALAINHKALIMLDPDVTKALFAEPERIQQALFEDKSIIVREYCNKCDVYKAKMHEVIEDMKDVLIERNDLQLKQ